MTLQEHMEQGKPVYAFFLDIKKAFDTVDRDMMLIKLHQMGI